MIIPNDTCTNEVETSENVRNDAYCSGDSESYREQMTFENSMIDLTVSLIFLV